MPMLMKSKSYIIIIFIIIMNINIIEINISYNAYSEDVERNITVRQINEKEELLSFNDLNVTLERIYNTTEQDDWSKGDGQNYFYDDISKYYIDNNINCKDIGNISLESNGYQGLWFEEGRWSEYSSSSIWDPINERMLILTLEHIWSYNPNNDTFTMKSDIPIKRYTTGLAWNSNTNEMILVGGEDEKGQWFNDIWSYNFLLDEWKFINFTPFYRNEHSLVFDSTNNQIIVYGGIDPKYGIINETWIYSFNDDRFYQKHGYHNVTDHCSVWDTENNVMLVYGGYHFNESIGTIYYDNLSFYDPNTDSWKEKKNGKSVIQHSLIWNEKLKSAISYGGYDPTMSKYNNELWLFNTSNNEWIQLISSENPSANHIAVWDEKNDQMIIIGGFYYKSNNQNKFDNNDIRIFKFKSPIYYSNGYLVSSTFDLEKRIKLESIVINFSAIPVESLLTDIQLQIGYFIDDNWIYIGPDGTENSKFYIEKSQHITLDLDHISYFRYKLFLSTMNSSFSPIVNRITFNISHYQNELEFEIQTFDSELYSDNHIYEITYDSILPYNTTIYLYLKSSNGIKGSKWSEWELLLSGQKVLLTPTNRYYSLKARLRTTDNSLTPELKSVDIYFNRIPIKPDSIIPKNNSWINISEPTFKWNFNDEDKNDYQTGFQLQIAYDYKFEQIIYDTGLMNSLSAIHTIGVPLVEKNHYWRVSACDRFGSWSKWSNSFIFTPDISSPKESFLYSNSHFNSNIWYKKDRVYINWIEPDDKSEIAGFSFEFNNVPEFIPDKNIDMNITEYGIKRMNVDAAGILEYSDIKSGIWYFHLRSSDINNHWSNTTHLKILIDRELPKIDINELEKVNTGEIVNIIVNCNDTLSGIHKASLFWKFENDDDFKEQVFNNLNNSMNLSINFSVAVQPNLLDKEIDYYLKVEDKAGNIVFYNTEFNNTIKIYDNILPEIVYVSTNNSASKKFPITVLVYAVDNNKIENLKINFEDQNIQYNMIMIENNLFSFEINNELISILYKINPQTQLRYVIIAEDSEGNTIKSPINGSFLIDISTHDNDISSDQEEGTNQENLKRLLYLKFLSIIIIVLLLFSVLMIGYIKEKKIVLTIINKIGLLTRKMNREKKIEKEV